MDPQREIALAHVDRLIRRGQHIAERLQTVPDSAVDVRAWQEDCAAAINELSGGSKAHWLSRAYSGALLVRATDGGAMVEASVGEIVERIVDVLKRARGSLEQMDGAATADSAPPPVRRFDFVHNAELRPVLEQAYAESGRALEAGDAHHAFVTACSILEAIITDALSPDHHDVAVWAFDARIAAAERAGLIRGGCARLPAVARTYRDLPPGVPISERDAKVTRQVLNVVMRDLDPGR
jgi:hypothetical protein